MVAVEFECDLSTDLLVRVLRRALMKLLMELVLSLRGVQPKKIYIHYYYIKENPSSGSKHAYCLKKFKILLYFNLLWPAQHSFQNLKSTLR